jgi:hypothetical protein
MTFLLSEDKALREVLQGITVTDQKADGASTPRSVGVWFGQPDQELRNQSYPYITIDMIDVNHDNSREMRGKTNAPYLVPEGMTIGEGEGFETDLPIPVIIDYQITTYARHPRHDRELLAQLLYGKLPFRFGNLSVTEKSVTSGDTTTNTITVRRMDVIDVAKRDAVEQAKRLFINSVTVRISSEIPQLTYRKLYQVLHIDITSPTGGRDVYNDIPGYFEGDWNISIDI